MKLRKNQAGFSAFEFVVIVLVVAALTFAGYWVNHNHNNTTASTNSQTSSTQSPTASNVSSAPQVNTTSDLTKAEQILNQNNPATANTADSNQLNSQLSAF